MANFRLVFEAEDGRTESVVVAASDEQEAEGKAMDVTLPHGFGGDLIDVEETDDQVTDDA